MEESRGNEEREKREDREREPLFLQVLRVQGMTIWSSTIKIWFLQAYRMHY